MGHGKSSSKKEVYTDTGLPQKQEKPQIKKKWSLWIIFS